MSENRPTFRAAALQSLSSPDQLNQVVRVMPTLAWVALSASMMLIGVAVVWSIYGRLPTTVTGEGILIRRGGIFNIVSQGSGVVAEVTDMSVGTRIEKGQIIARLHQPELAQQVAAQQVAIVRLQNELRELNEVAELLSKVQNLAQRDQQLSTKAFIEGREAQVKSLSAVEQSLQPLSSEGLITKQRQEDIKQQILVAQNEINQARGIIKRASIEAVQAKTQSEDKQRDASTRLAQARGLLADLQLREKLSSIITSNYNGIVVEAMTTRGDMVQAGKTLMSVEISDEKLEAIIYLPPNSNAKLVKPGMKAQISPVTAKKERFGYLVSSVTNVSKFPSTEAGMLAVVNNPALVAQMSKSGPPIAVTVELIADSKTKSGYEWSSNAGRELEVSSGTVAIGSFVVEEKAPISLVIPLIRSAVGL